MILHLCPRDDWQVASATGTYAPSSLAAQGFIHLSSEHQVHLPANALFRGRTDLLLLHIDEDRLPVAVVWEDGDPPDPGGMQFPHLYAALPVDAVVNVTEYRPSGDGTFPPL